MMMSKARAASLRGYCSLVDELGGDGVALLQRFGIDRAAIDSDDAVVPADVIGWALEVAAAELDCPDFGLTLAGRQDETMLGPLAVALVHSSTASEAIACAARFLFTQNTGISVALVPDPEGEPGMVALNYRDSGEFTGFSQGVDLAAGTIHRMMGRILGDEYPVRSVHLPHEALVPPKTYTEYFGTKVRFGMPTTMFRFAAAALDRPVPGNSTVMRAMAMEYLTKNYSELERTTTAQVRVTIENIMVGGPPTIRTVARALSTHERTLQRMLSTEGTSFREILDGARRDVAYRLLCETNISMSGITTLVGLREQSALTRAVRRWFDATPQQIRNAARAERGKPPSLVLRPPVSR